MAQSHRKTRGSLGFPCRSASISNNQWLSFRVAGEEEGSKEHPAGTVWAEVPPRAPEEIRDRSRTRHVHQAPAHHTHAHTTHIHTCATRATYCTCTRAHHTHGTHIPAHTRTRAHTTPHTHTCPRHTRKRTRTRIHFTCVRTDAIHTSHTCTHTTRMHPCLHTHYTHTIHIHIYTYTSRAHATYAPHVPHICTRITCTYPTPACVHAAHMHVYRSHAHATHRHMCTTHVHTHIHTPHTCNRTCDHHPTCAPHTYTTHVYTTHVHTTCMCTTRMHTPHAHHTCAHHTRMHACTTHFTSSSSPIFTLPLLSVSLLLPPLVRTQPAWTCTCGLPHRHQVGLQPSLRFEDERSPTLSTLEWVWRKPVWAEETEPGEHQCWAPQDTTAAMTNDMPRSPPLCSVQTPCSAGRQNSPGSIRRH